MEREGIVQTSQIKVWRDEIRIPVMLQKVELTKEQREEVESKQVELT